MRQMFRIVIYFKGRKLRTQMLLYRGGIRSNIKNAFEIFEKKKKKNGEKKFF